MWRMFPMLRCCVSFVLLSSVFLLSANAATLHFEKQLLPVLKDNCLACHNKTTTKGGLNMESPELMIQGGDSGSSLKVGKGDKSLIYLAAAGEWDSEMPPKSNKVGAVKLTSGELAMLKQWIDEGALYSARQEKLIAWEPLPESYRPIYATAITGEGSFAAAARGNQISLYHLPTGALVTRLTDEALLKSGLYKQPGVAHRDIVPALVFSPDGSRLASGSFREVKLWKRTVSAPRSVSAPVLPAVGKFTLAPAAAGAVALIDQPTGKVLRELKHGGAVTAFVLSADQQRLATAGNDHKLKIWETATGKLQLEIQGDFTATRALVEQTDVLAKATAEVAWQNLAIKKEEKEVTDLAAQLKKANELNVAAKKDLETKSQAVKTPVAAKAAAEKALADIQAQVAKIPADKPDPALVKKQTEALAKLEKTKSDLVVAEEALKRAETAVQDTAREIQTVTAASQIAAGRVTAAKAALEAAKKTVELATAEKNSRAKNLLSAMPTLTALAFSPQGTQVAGLDAEGQVRVWSVASGRPIRQQTMTTLGKVQSLVWPSAEGWIVTGEKGSVLMPDESQAEWKLERVLGSGDGKSPISDRVNALTFTKDGKTLAVGSGEPSRGGDITLWDLASGQIQATYEERHLDSVLTLDFSPDGKLLASGGADKAVRITDLATGKMIKVFEGHTHHVLGVAWRGDGRMLVSAGADNVVKIWDWTVGDRRKNVEGWDKEVTAAHYLGNSDQIATTSGDGKVRLINSDGAEVKLLPGVKGFMNALSATQTGDWLVAGGDEGVLHVWDVTTGKATLTLLP